MAESNSGEVEIMLDDLVVPAGDLLSDADTSTRDTRPYEIPIEEDELFGEVTRTSAMFTVPIALDELPDDAFPTEVTIVNPEA
jgi:hypothetical protein